MTSNIILQTSYISKNIIHHTSYIIHQQQIIGIFLANIEINTYFCTQGIERGIEKRRRFMEDMKFNNRLEQVQWYEQQQGWGPLTDEDKQAIDEAVRMVTNL